MTSMNSIYPRSAATHLSRATRIVVLLMTLSSLAVAQDAVKTLSLEDCIQRALTNSTAVLKGNNAVQSSGAQVLASYGQFLPDVSVGGTYAYNTGKNLLTVTAPTLVESRRSNMTYQVVTSLNLFNGFYDQSSLKASLLNKEAAQLSLQRAKQQVTLDVTQTFFQIILDQQVVEFAQQNFQTSNQREQQLKALIDTGRKAASDLYQQQSQTSMDKQFLTTAENKLRNDKILLLQKLRINDDEAAYRFEDVVPNEITAQNNENEQALIQQALEQRYDLKSSKLNQEAVVLGERKFRSGYLPKVYLSAGAYVTAAHYNKLKINNLDQYPSEQRSLGTQLSDQLYGVVALNASWTIFDKNFTRSNVAIARVASDNARIDYENTTIQVVSEVRQALGNYRTAQQQLENTRTGLAAAQKAFDSMSGRYDIGSANFIELSTAQIDRKSVV